MRSTRRSFSPFFFAAIGMAFLLISACKPPVEGGYDTDRYHPIHFKPLIDSATNADCLKCHQEILAAKPLERSPAGLERSEVKAWYQTVSTYDGEQEDFHIRHMSTPMAQELMQLRCNTCHQGHDPREEAHTTAILGPNSDAHGHFTLRKSVDVEESCLMCHGSFNYEVMNLPGPWREHGSLDCMSCHDSLYRTVRHQVNYLHPEAIEQAGRKNPEVCFGCHGGRAWYRTPYPYARHPWPNMEAFVPATPDWALQRPTRSPERFRLPDNQ